MIQIPRHMSKCPVRGGLPVPAIVSTTRGHTALETSRYPNSELMTVWVPENDVPDFGKYDDEKHRACMVGRYCHVCERTERFLLVCDPQRNASHDGQTIVLRDRLRPLVKQPWVCAGCLAFATQHCPPLRDAIAKRRGVVFFPREVVLVTAYYKPVDVGDPVPPPGARVVLSIKLAMVDYSIQALWAWAGQVKRSRP